MIMHLLAADSDVDERTLEKLRERCVDDVSHTNGKIAFSDILRYQKGLGNG